MELNNGYSYLPVGERVAILETKMTEVTSGLEDIKGKLDELLQLKAKGMGAMGLVSLLVGSGLIGIIVTVLQFFNKPHL